jgi:hypothetical protein
MTIEKAVPDEWELLGSWIARAQDLSFDKDAYPLAPDSILVGDELGITGGASVAAVVRSLLDSAVDDLASAFALVTGAGRLSPVGIPTLVRGTIELAGLGMWVLTGQERSGRQERALRVAHDSYSNASKFYDQLSKSAAAPANVRAEATQGAADNKAWAVTLADDAAKRGLKKTRVTTQLNRTDALKEVDMARGTRFFSNWQLCSGFAHGLAWASQFFHIKVYTHAMEGGGMLTARTLEADRALTMLLWGKQAIEELTGTFAAGRMPAPGMGADASLVSTSKVKMQADALARGITITEG